jgi:hypothetical protein
VQAVTAQWYPITLLVQAQIIRAGFFVLIFGYLYFAHYLARRYQSKGASELDLSVLGAAFVVSPLPIVPVGIWIWQRFVGSVWWRFHAAWVAVTLSFVTSLGLAYHYALWSPGIHIYAHRTPWYDVQLWARDHTPKEALFITPPHLWSFYDSEWRVFSERSTVATHSELLEAAFVPDYVDYWRPRFEAVAPGALDHFAGDFFANQETTAEAFYSLADDDLLRVAHTYGAAYLVVEKPHLRPWTVLYANSDFVVYALPMNNS